ncbi:unnamed protein product [Blepharisma stoltei]|uniref:Trichohyalin-plectin-homology domain-containing protein n=1 Tax=Blepharisma stoltei TaxID=1481888 RepID=A0AAU9KBH4_9CILI|nr:unnamed protein product [Blepharisma stoltei]
MINFSEFKSQVKMAKKSVIQELYPHLFEEKEQAQSIINSMLKIEDEASSIKERATGKKQNWTPSDDYKENDDDFAIAYRVMESYKKEQKDKEKLDKARSNSKKVYREFDPRPAMEERHQKVLKQRQQRLENQNLISVGSKLEMLREERRKFQEEISPDELEAMKQLVKKEAEEIRQQDLIRKKHERAAEERERMAVQKQNLAKEKERIEKNFLEFKVKQIYTKILNTINSDERKNVNWAFKQILSYTIELKSKMIKIARKYRFKRINKYMARWRKYVKDFEIQKELERQRIEQEKMQFLNDTADNQYESWLLRRGLISWCKFMNQLRIEREQEEEEIKRKEKVERLMEFVRQRAEEEKELRIQQERKKQIEIEWRKQQQLIEMIEKRKIMEYEESQKRNQGVSQPKIDAAIDTPVIFEEAAVQASFDENREFVILQQENQQRTEPEKIVIEEEISYQQSESPTQNKKPQKVPKELAKMKQREEERKKKREALEQKYKEKRIKEEQEKKEKELIALAEEKKKKKEIIEKKKAEERQKKEAEEKKKQALMELKEKCEKSDKFYYFSLVAKMIKFWKMYCSNVKEAKIKAEVFGERAIKKLILRYFIEGIAVSRQETQEIDRRRMDFAYEHYLMRLKSCVFLNFIRNRDDHMERELEMAQHHDKYLLRISIQAWAEAKEVLKEERIIQENKDNQIALRFRLKKLGPKVIKTWKEAVEEEIEKKLKDQHTQAMWDKVQGWLKQPTTQYEDD